MCNFLIIVYLSRIIVSAPNGTAINAAVNNTGVLFSCAVEQGTCIPLTGNGTGHDRRLYDVDGAYIKFIFYDNASFINFVISIANNVAPAFEEKQNQFLGVSMDNKENMFIVSYPINSCSQVT